MIYKVFTVYDSKVEAYMAPFQMTTKAEAIRAFNDAANDPKTAFCKHPGDFTLFEIAEYDNQEGAYMNHEAKINLGTALEIKGVQE